MTSEILQRELLNTFTASLNIKSTAKDTVVITRLRFSERPLNSYIFSALIYAAFNMECPRTISRLLPALVIFLRYMNMGKRDC